MKIIVIGTGNVGFHLCQRMKEVGIKLRQIVGRKEMPMIETTADVYILAVSDAAIVEVAEQIALLLPNTALVLHTSGTTSGEVLAPFFKNYGVLYPLQTFNKDLPIDFSAIPIFINSDKHEAMHELAKAFHGPAQMAWHALTTLPFWLALSGVATSYYMYMVNPALPAAIKSRVQPIYTLLENKYYLDWINENILARGARAVGSGLWKWGDQVLIDGLVVNGSWKLVAQVSGVIRKVQTGYLYHYALIMILGVFVLMTYFVWLK